MRWQLLVALAAASVAWSQDDSLRTRIGQMNREVLAHPTRAALTERAQVLKDLIIRHPAQARELLLPAADRARLRALADPGSLESFEQATSSTVVIADSEDFKSSTHLYLIDTPSGRVTA